MLTPGMLTPTPAGRHWPAHLLIGWINLAMSAPVIFLYIGLPLVLRQQGWSGTEIGLLQLAGLPALLKLLLATWVERMPIGRRSYRNWAAGLIAAYVGLLVLLALHDPAVSSPWVLFALAVALNLAVAWADIPVNALAIRLLPDGERQRAGTIRSAATSLAAIMGGGMMLVLHGRFGWAVPALVLAACLALALPLLLLTGPMRALFPDQARAAGPAMRRAPAAGLAEWGSYFRMTGHGQWALLLAFYVPFIGAVWVYLKPLLLDHGLAAEQIAVAIGMIGGLISALSGIAAGQLSRRIGMQAALPLVALLCLAAILALMGVLAWQAPAGLVLATALTIAVALGAASGLIFAQMMQMVRPGLTALDYGIQSNIFILARTIIPLMAGVMFDRLGPVGMLAGLALGTLAGLILSLRQPAIGRQPAQALSSTI